MYTVRKVAKNEHKQKVGQAGRVTVYTATPKGWAVVDEKDIPVSRINRFTGKLEYEVFNTKKAAQMQADWLNAN